MVFPRRQAILQYGHQRRNDRQTTLESKETTRKLLVSIKMIFGEMLVFFGEFSKRPQVGWYFSPQQMS